MCVQTIDVTKLDRTNFSLYNSCDRKLVEEYYPNEAILLIPSCGGFPEKSIRCYYGNYGKDMGRIFIARESYEANKVYLKYAMDKADDNSKQCNADYSMIKYGGQFIRNYKFRDYTRVSDMFEKGNVSMETKELLFTDKHAAVCKISTNHLGIRCGEDNWKIKYDPADKKYILLHNNYEMVGENERFIEHHPEYHFQGAYDNMDAVIRYICGYSFTAHVEAVQVTKSLIEEIEKKENSILNRIKIWFENLMFYPVRGIVMQATAA